MSVEPVDGEGYEEQEMGTLLRGYLNVVMKVLATGTRRRPGTER